SAGLIALGIDEGDQLVAVKITDGTKDIMIATKSGISIRFPESDVRSMGRAAYGVKGITLEDGDEVVGADVVENGTAIMTVTENGYGKRTMESEYRSQSRGGKGVYDIKTSERNGQVSGIVQVKDEDEVMLLTNGGMLIRLKVNEVSVIGRNTQGVRLISLESENEKVTAISKLPEVTGEAEVEGGGEVEIDQVKLGGPSATDSNASADNVPGDTGDIPEPGETPDGTPEDEE
ncbi:MAG: DNA gyrase C-terminal beta-propeller domain-containing protein, partial [Myxococcaceae bacterium]